jgi:heme exporter protein CcmD
MDLSSPHLGFVAVSYGLFAVVLLALLGSAYWQGRQLKRQLQAKGLNDPGSTSADSPESTNTTTNKPTHKP